MLTNHSIKTVCFLIFYFFYGNITSNAQEFTFYHYGLEEGLSQETIRVILKDSNGFLWLGTQDGLNRFDGNSFKVFKNNIKNTLSISGNYINALVENTDQSIWIGTGNKGVCYYNPLTDTFNQTNFNTGNCSSLIKDDTKSIYATFLDGRIVVFKKDKNNCYSHNEVLEINSSLTSSAFFNSSLYVGDNRGHIYVVKNSKIEESNIKLPDCVVKTIVCLSNEIWIGTSIGLYVYNISTKITSPLDIEQFNSQATEKLTIESLKIKDNKFYVGTDNGLYILSDYNNTNNSFKTATIYYGDKNTSNSITSNRVYDVLVDNNLLWIGTNNLDVASLKPPVFKTINTNSKLKLQNNHVFSILKHKDYCFIGTRNGLHCIDKQGNVTNLTKDNTNQALAFSVIRGITIDADNNLWLATTKGVSIINLTNFNPKSPNITSLYHDKDDKNSLSSNKTRSIYKDHKNNIWITTYGGGLNLFTGNLNTKNYSFKAYRAGTLKNSISSDFIFNISQDNRNNYWITSENGLNKLQFKNNNYNQPKFTVFKSDNTNPNALQNNTTLHTLHDRDNILWVATQNGLHKFDNTTQTFKNYNEDYGLTNNYIYSLLEDNSGFIWLSTNDGLFKFDKVNETFFHYTTKDGLQSSEFNLGAHFFDSKNNLMYFGGINGYNVFNPENTTKIDVEGSLALTSLKVKDKEVNPITYPKVTNTGLKNLEQITLKHSDFPCYIQFSDLDLRPTKNNQFVYSLNNTQWNSLKNNREIQLLHLPQGKHTLQIQGQSRNTLWSKPPLQLTIKVIPPWYKSNLAYVLYFALSLATAFIFYRLSLQRQLAGQEAKQLKELDNLKSQFITNITHEFRTPLTVILGYANNLKSSITNTEHKNAVTSIEHNSNDLLHLVNEMLDLAKLEQGKLKLNPVNTDLVEFLNYMVNSYSSFAEANNISLNLNTELKELYLDFDTEKMRQIISNLISNAIKFSKDTGTVLLDLKTENSKAIIQVADQGIGIPKADLPHVFDRFYRSSNKNQQPGSGIGLALTKELVALMKGEINVTSIVNFGSTFTIKLPITTNAVKYSETFLNEVKTTSISQLESVTISEALNTILIVEDNTEIIKYIKSCLLDTYNLHFAKNGEKGLELAQNIIPDIIITDVMMPIMDGFVMTEKLQNIQTTNHIPIIMLTAKSMQSDKLTGFKSGADAYLTKPFLKEELLLRIETLIAKRKQLQEHYGANTNINNTETSKPDKNVKFLNSIISLIHNNIENTDYNASSLALDLHMSESQLYRKLKALTNKSIAVYIRSIRLEKAKKLLKTTDLTVSEIAYATGFTNPNWFSKIFKETYKTTPSKIRK